MKLPFAVPPPDVEGARFADTKDALGQVVMGSITSNRAVQLGIKHGSFDPKTTLITALGKDGAQSLRNGPEYGTINRVMGDYASSINANFQRALFTRNLLSKVVYNRDC